MDDDEHAVRPDRSQGEENEDAEGCREQATCGANSEDSRQALCQQVSNRPKLTDARSERDRQEERAPVYGAGPKLWCRVRQAAPPPLPLFVTARLADLPDTDEHR